LSCYAQTGIWNLIEIVDSAVRKRLEAIS